MEQENPVFWVYIQNAANISRSECIVYALAGVEQYLFYKETYFLDSRLSRVDTMVSDDLYSDAREFFADIEGAVYDFFGEDNPDD